MPEFGVVVKGVMDVHATALGWGRGRHGMRTRRIVLVHIHIFMLLGEARDTTAGNIRSHLWL